MAARAVQWSGMREIQIRMEEAFIYLIRRQEAKDGR